MTMGLFDVPMPVLSAIDGVIAALPSALRLWLWGMIGGVVSMGLYAVFSPQRRLRAITWLSARSQRRLNAYEGNFESAWTLLARHLKLAFARLGWVLGPTLLSALPVLFLYAWLGNNFAYDWPAVHTSVAVRTQPVGYRAQWSPSSGEASPRAVIRLRDPAGMPVGDVPVHAPVAVLHKRKWWNRLFGNPAGYLDDASPVEHLALALPVQEHLPVGPAWVRGWEFSFLLALMLSALSLRAALRLQ